MTQTFTPALDLTAKQTKKEEEINFPEFAEPSADTIQNILNFSKNLEVKHSKSIPPIEIMKS